MTDQDQIPAFDEISAKFAAARKALGKVVFGQKEVIDLTLATLAAGGHGLLVGAPGLAKTLLVTSLADHFGAFGQAGSIYAGPHARRCSWL